MRPSGLVRHLPPLDRLGQPPPRHKALFPLRELEAQGRLLEREVALVPLEVHGHFVRGERELGPLFGLDARELLALAFAEDVDARGVQGVHAGEGALLAEELGEVVGGDVAAGHAVRAAGAVGFHVAEARFARSALELQGAGEVDLRGEVAVLEVRHGFCVAPL